MHKEIPALTGLRAIAAAQVFFTHWITGPGFVSPDTRAFLFGTGQVGVTIFFALSGFLITIRYADELRERQIGFGRYWIRRFARTYPVYLFVLTFFCVIPEALTGRLTLSPLGIAANYLLLHTFVAPISLSGIVVSWTLSLEEVFYLLAPLWLRRPPWANPLAHGALLCVGIWVLVFAMRRVLAVAGLGGVENLQALNLLAEFLWGVTAGYLYLNRLKRSKQTALPPNSTIAWVGLGLLLASSIFQNLSPEHPLEIQPRVAAQFVSMAASILIFGLAIAPETHFLTQTIGSRVMQYLGRISYSLYLIQVTSLLAALREWTEAPGGMWKPLAAYLVCNLIAAGLYELVEEPCRHRIRGFAAPNKIG